MNKNEGSGKGSCDLIYNTHVHHRHANYVHAYRQSTGVSDQGTWDQHQEKNGAIFNLNQLAYEKEPRNPGLQVVRCACPPVVVDIVAGIRLG